MGYIKKQWKARQGVGLNKFSIDGKSAVTLVNIPDNVVVPGDAFSEENMNDLEDRVSKGLKESSFNRVYKNLTELGLPNGSSVTDILNTMANDSIAQIRNVVGTISGVPVDYGVLVIEKTSGNIATITYTNTQSSITSASNIATVYKGVASFNLSTAKFTDVRFESNFGNQLTRTRTSETEGYVKIFEIALTQQWFSAAIDISFVDANFVNTQDYTTNATIIVTSNNVSNSVLVHWLCGHVEVLKSMYACYDTTYASGTKVVFYKKTVNAFDSIDIRINSVSDRSYLEAFTFKLYQYNEQVVENALPDTNNKVTLYEKLRWSPQPYFIVSNNLPTSQGQCTDLTVPTTLAAYTMFAKANQVPKRFYNSLSSILGVSTIPLDVSFETIINSMGADSYFVQDLNITNYSNLLVGIGAIKYGTLMITVDNNLNGALRFLAKLINETTLFIYESFYRNADVRDKWTTWVQINKVLSSAPLIGTNTSIPTDLNTLYDTWQDVRFKAASTTLSNNCTNKPETATNIMGFNLECVVIRRSDNPFRTYLQTYTSQGGTWTRHGTQQLTTDIPTWNEWLKMLNKNDTIARARNADRAQVAEYANSNLSEATIDQKLIDVNARLDRLGSSLYDITIRTQSDFSKLLASPTWLGAKRVLFVGNGGTLEFTRDMVVIKIPSTVKHIKGTNSATIEMTSAQTSMTFGYEELPQSNDYSIENLKVVSKCPNYATTFQNCRNLTNCASEATDTNGDTTAYGFNGCTNLTNCKSISSSPSTSTHVAYACRAYYNCTNLVNCEGCATSGVGGNGYTFYNISRATNCRQSNEGDSTTAMWGGTNKNIDISTCKKGLYAVDNSTLNN